MLDATMVRFAERLRRDLGNSAISSDEPSQGVVRIPASRYTELPATERDLVLAAPRIAAVSPAPGACEPVGDHALIVCDREGHVRAFRNACRHRGTRLVDAPCAVKAFVCPYHAWTYDLAGTLIDVPHAASFAGLDLETRHLVQLRSEVRHGLVWLGANVERHLDALDADVAALACERHVLWKRSRLTRRCNWKLVVEAFLDGYHIRVLHRDSVYRYFLDAASVAERAGPHSRSITGRRALRDAPADLAGQDLRQLVTPSLFIFPSTFVVEHPDFLSIMTLTPLAADVTEWDHMMLVPKDRAGETQHWERSWTLIEGGVFQSEDLWVCEQAQRSLSAGAADELVFGALELPAQWFHAALAEELRTGPRY